MAVTAHYCSKDSRGRLVLRSHLIAFRHISGSHTGENLARYFVEILEDVGATQRVSNLVDSLWDHTSSIKSLTDWHDHARQCIEL